MNDNNPTRAKAVTENVDLGRIEPDDYVNCYVDCCNSVDCYRQEPSKIQKLPDQPVHRVQNLPEHPEKQVQPVQYLPKTSSDLLLRMPKTDNNKKSVRMNKQKNRDIETKKCEKVMSKSGQIKKYFEPVVKQDSNTKVVVFGTMEVGQVGVGTTTFENLGQNYLKKSLGAEFKGAKKKDFGHFLGPRVKSTAGQPTYCPNHLRNGRSRLVTVEGESPPQNTYGPNQFILR